MTRVGSQRHSKKTSVLGDPPWHKQHKGNTGCSLGMEMTNRQKFLSAMENKIWNFKMSLNLFLF